MRRIATTHGVESKDDRRYISNLLTSQGLMLF